MSCEARKATKELQQEAMGDSNSNAQQAGQSHISAGWSEIAKLLQRASQDKPSMAEPEGQFFCEEVVNMHGMGKGHRQGSEQDLATA